MGYVEGYLLPVKTAKREDYRVMATKMAAIWRELGALSVVEAWADDTPVGELTSFPRAVHLMQGESVVFSSMTFRDRAHRDQVIAAGMQHAALMALMQAGDLDGKRMMFGGFDVIVAA